jgi:hypothetical protein
VVEFVQVPAQRCSPVRCGTSGQPQSGSSLTSQDGPSRQATSNPGPGRPRPPPQHQSVRTCRLEATPPPAIAGRHAYHLQANPAPACGSGVGGREAQLQTAAIVQRGPGPDPRPGRRTLRPYQLVAHRSHAYELRRSCSAGAPRLRQPSTGWRSRNRGVQTVVLQKVLPNPHAGPILQ